jgi:hypothetical protein
LRLRPCTGCHSDDRSHPSDSPAGLSDPGGRERRHAAGTRFQGLLATIRAHPTGHRYAHVWAVEDTDGDRRTPVRKGKADETERGTNDAPACKADREDNGRCRCDRVHGLPSLCAGRHRAVATERSVAQLWRRLGLRSRLSGGGRRVPGSRHPGECLCNRPVLRHGLGVSTRVRRSGRDLLRAILVPDNAFLRSSGYDWQCDRGYRQDRETCVPIVLPDNAYLTDDTSGSGWACDRGFTARSGACVPIAVPENGYLTNADYGDEWACERGFFEIDGRCDPVALPANAFLDQDSYGPGWRCERGFAGPKHLRRDRTSGKRASRSIRKPLALRPRFSAVESGVRSWTIMRPDQTTATPPASGCGSDAG